MKMLVWIFREMYRDGLLQIIVLVVAVLLAVALPVARLDRRCLAAGFPHSEWKLIGPNYCIRRTDQTDVVVRADTLERVKSVTPEPPHA